jgi:diguanylate cyclase
MFDVDDFKKFNDEYGHETGDIVLQRVAGAIRKNIKSSDFAFRFGGDEMAVVIEGDKYTAAKVAKRIVSSLQDNNDLKVTLSIGIAESEPEIDFDTLKRRADAALYAAKEKGKNKIVLWKNKTEENAVEEQK